MQIGLRHTLTPDEDVIVSERFGFLLIRRDNPNRIDARKEYSRLCDEKLDTSALARREQPGEEVPE